MKLLKASHLQTRAIDSYRNYPGIDAQLLAIQGRSERSYSIPSIREALAVPAVFRAVTLIANTVGSLTLQAFRNGQLMDVPPRVVARPGVFTTTRDFLRDTAWCLASRGEFLWWEIESENDGTARRFLLLPPEEVTVAWDQELPIVRTYEWRNRKIPAGDIVHGTFAREPGGLRGIGPLQVCGAALSVAVEADEWAARFFRRGGSPSTVLYSEESLSPEESEKLIEQWLQRESNEVRTASGGIEPKPWQIDPESAQLLESRLHSAADVATMFGMDADLLNAAVSGSSLTYQNVGQRFDNFIRSCLAPGYLEPIETAISERLVRTTVARFSTTAFLRADVRTQADVYSTLITAGMEERRAASIAGLDTIVDMLPVPAPEPIATGRIPVA